jgi:Icc-related predicted phosphoesterase
LVTARRTIGALGDIHGAFDAARAIIASHPEIPLWLCVGDIASEDGRYESLGAPVYFVHGNNDNFDAIASGDMPPDLRHIANGTAMDLGRGFSPAVRVAGLGGTFAPTWYETPAADLPHPKKGSARATELADKRRHFVREEVDACKALREGVDILLTHEAAKPFRPFPGGRGPDAGKAQVNEVLAAMQPRLHLFGHHHRFSEQIREAVPSVGLELVTKSYLLIDIGTLHYERRDVR